MRSQAIVILLALLAASPLLVRAQSGSVIWSVLDGGSGVPASGNTAVVSSVGQVFVGTSQAGENGVMSGFVAALVTPLLSTGISGNEEQVVPTTYELKQNYPNPFNPKTVVSSQLPVASEVKLVVYDLLGREVAVLVNERRGAGTYQDSFDGTGLASGVYIYRLTAGSFVQTRTMLLLK